MVFNKCWITYGLLPTQNSRRGRLTDGTSPRLWGDCLLRGVSYVWLRYIPTPVGRLLREQATTHVIAVHPHACGEIDRILTRIAGGDGTSPRLWGDCRRDKLAACCFRYIPTPVGRFRTRRCKALLNPVHPHACGEIISVSRSCHLLNGTSPRLWGDLYIGVAFDGRCRYIPTPVGRLETERDPGTHNAVHPHACGEILVRLVVGMFVSGTSPRLWGDCC